MINLIRWRLKRYLNLFYFSRIRKKIPSKAVNKGVLFIHIPKAAGMSICKSLYKGEIGHKRAIDFYRADRSTFGRLNKFTIVRDPYTRLCSAYNFLLHGGMEGYYYDKEFSKFLNQFESFESFVFDWLAIDGNKYRYMHFIPQTEFLLINDSLAVDKIGKVEELPSFIHEINKLWGLDLEVKKENKSKVNLISKDYINKNIKLKEVIYEIYKSDFEYLNYDR